MSTTTTPNRLRKTRLFWSKAKQNKSKVLILWSSCRVENGLCPEYGILGNCEENAWTKNGTKSEAKQNKTKQTINEALILWSRAGLQNGLCPEYGIVWKCEENARKQKGNKSEAKQSKNKTKQSAYFVKLLPGWKSAVPKIWNCRETHGQKTETSADAVDRWCSTFGLTFLLKHFASKNALQHQYKVRVLSHWKIKP